MRTDLELQITTWLEPFRGVVDELWSTLVPSIEGNVRRLMVSSSREGEGSTTVAAALAVGLAKYYQRQTLLVEANAATPGLASYLGLGDEPGVSEYIQGVVTLPDVCYSTRLEHLGVAPWGARNSSGLSRSGLTRLFEDARDTCELMIVDAGPILDRPEGRLILPSVDATLLVSRARKSSQDDVAQASSILRNAPSEFLGSVLNWYKREMPGQ